MTLSAAIEAGVSTMYVLISHISCNCTGSNNQVNRFVGLGEDPGILAIRAPQLFGVGPYYHSIPFAQSADLLPKMIVETYPDVVEGVPRNDV